MKSRFLHGAALSALLLTSTAYAETPGNTLVVAKAIDDIISLDPASNYEHSGTETINNVYEQLMQFEPEDVTKLVGGAVESWTVSGDGKTFELKLRPGQMFHSGNPMTSDDVVFSLQRMVKLNKTPAIVVAQFGWKPDNIEKLVVARDPMTVELAVTAELAPSLVLNVLANNIFSVLDKKLVLEHETDNDLGAGWLRNNSAGSGPYVLKSWRPNETLVMDANPNFRLGAPKIKRILIRHVPEPASQRLLLEHGDVDIARSLTPDLMQGVAGNPDIAIEESVEASIQYLGLNQKFEPFKKPEVVKALKYLVDYQGMADSFVKGQWAVHQSFWPKGFDASMDKIPYKLDVEKAKELLAKGGYPDGFTVKLNVRNYSPYLDMAQSVQNTMRLANIKVEINATDLKQMVTAYRGRQHEITHSAWIPDYRDPQSHAFAFIQNPNNADDSPDKTVAWRNAWEAPQDVKELADAAVKERNTEKRMQMYVDLQERLQDDSPYIFMFQGMTRIASRKNVQNISIDPANGVLYYRLTSK